MDKNEKIEITTIPFGENKTLFVPLDDNKKYCNALGIFVKNDGTFASPIFIENVMEHIDETTPVVAFRFKTKRSINNFIKFLRFYRNEIYKKQYKELQK